MLVKLKLNTKEDLLKLINTFGIETVFGSLEHRESNINDWFQDYIGDILDFLNINWKKLLNKTNLIFDNNTLKYLYEKKGTEINTIFYYYANNKIVLSEYFRNIADNLPKSVIDTLNYSVRDYVYNTYTVFYKAKYPETITLVRNETDFLSDIDKNTLHNFISYFAEVINNSVENKDLSYYCFPSEEMFLLTKEKLHSMIEEMQGNQRSNLVKLKNVFLRPLHSSSNLEIKDFKYITIEAQSYLDKDANYVEITVEKTKKGKFVRNYIFNIQVSKLKESYMEIKNQIHEKVRNLALSNYK